MTPVISYVIMVVRIVDWKYGQYYYRRFVMNELLVAIAEDNLERIYNNPTRLIIQPDGLPNEDWTMEVEAIRVLTEMSKKYSE